jgi:hypothetical protein
MEIVYPRTEPYDERVDVDAKAQPDVVTPAVGDTLENPLDLTMMDDEEDEAFVNRIGPLVLLG